jgi:hypothetical protein
MPMGSSPGGRARDAPASPCPVTAVTTPDVDSEVQDNRNLLSEQVGLQERLSEVEAAHAAKAKAMVEEISKALVDFGLSPIQGIP